MPKEYVVLFSLPFDATDAPTRVAGCRAADPDAVLARMRVAHPNAERVCVKPVPSLRTLERYSMDGVCPTPCGCRVEPDGKCSHGVPSWLLLCGVV